MFAEAGSPHAPEPPPPATHVPSPGEAAPRGPRIVQLAVPGGSGGGGAHPDSLFERFGWLYAFFREYLFRDDTEGIITAVWPQGRPPEGSWLVEIGCGPGFYTRRLAARFPGLHTLGVDRSRQQLRRARRAARRAGLENCRFEQADALALGSLLPVGSVDTILAPRLFTILPEPARALAEMHRVLSPGGRCLLAEPLAGLGAKVPLRLMWLLAQAVGFFGDYGVYREPARAATLTQADFGTLVQTQPWSSVWRWQDAQYQYAVCEKAPAGAVAPEPAAEEDFSI